MSNESRFVVGPEAAGTRLDLVLTQGLGIGRAKVKRVLEEGRVRVDGRRAGLGQKGDFLPAGTVVEVVGFERPEDMRALPHPELSLPVLAEGPGWVVIDKPAGMAVHPLESGETGTVLNWVASRWPEVHGVGEGGLRSGVVHRLDVETSGVLLFATEAGMWERLRKAFAEHRTKKVYRAIVAGNLHGERREIMDLVVAQHKPAKVAVVNPTQGYTPPGARQCDLTWRAVDVMKRATLVEIELGTGFLHQIRVMMAGLGHPVVGDRLYGSGKGLTTPRQMLHAAWLDVGPVKAKSPDPEDFVNALKAMDE